jgi:hypothetical protein
MKCSDCIYYAQINDVEGQCMLNPPILDPHNRVVPTVAESWVRPVVYYDDFCSVFSAKKIVKKPRKSSVQNTDVFPAKKTVDF